MVKLLYKPEKLVPVNKYGVIEIKDKTLAYIKLETEKQRALARKTTKRIIGNAIRIILNKKVNAHPMLQAVTDNLIKPRAGNKKDMERNISSLTGYKAKFK